MTAASQNLTGSEVTVDDDQKAQGGKTSPLVFLQELLDENYEPSQQQIAEYAEWLGFETDDFDKGLMWIAKEGLKAPLPSGWKPCKTEEGELFYFNFSNGDSLWDHPCDGEWGS